MNTAPSQANLSYSNSQPFLEPESLPSYIYIYMFVCVCVCLCVCIYTPSFLRQ